MKKSFTRRRFSVEFKREAVLVILDGSRSPTEVARELDINVNMLHNWRRQYLDDQDNAFPGKGNLKPEDAEFRRLSRELEEVKLERDILKKALAIFSKTPK